MKIMVRITSQNGLEVAKAGQIADRQTDRQTDICDSRVAFATEKHWSS